MRVGGRHLGQVKAGLVSVVAPGVTFEQIEAEAQRLIRSFGATPSFSTVPGYSWATCLMKNDEVCHGIPRGKVVEAGDVIKIDVGLIWEGYHLDTTTTVGVAPIAKETQHFLEVGRQALKKAIEKTRIGNTVFDISRAMERVVSEAGYGSVYQLTGHGVGKELHMEPSIPCIGIKSDKKIKIAKDMTLAVEVMYTSGEPHLEVAADGWTYATADGSLGGMFEETVLVTESGPEVLT
jgi:methionyl aminopeptidase